MSCVFAFGSYGLTIIGANKLYDLEDEPLEEYPKSLMEISGTFLIMKCFLEILGAAFGLIYLIVCLLCCRRELLTMKQKLRQRSIRGVVDELRF